MPKTKSAVVQRDFSVGFFDDPPTQMAIQTVSSAERVTIFVGAGAAADQHYPSWSELVSRLLSSKLSQFLGDHTDDELHQVGTLVTSQYYQIPTATILDQWYRDSNAANLAISRRNDDLRRTLYEKSEDIRPVSPSLIEEILFLAYTRKAAGKSVHVVTTNYDDLFEQVAEASFRLQEFSDWGLSVQPFYDEPPTKDHDLTNCIPVVHIHGFLPHNSKTTSKNVIFSEPDYIEWDETSPFKSYLMQTFAKGVTLMVGASLRALPD